MFVVRTLLITALLASSVAGAQAPQAPQPSAFVPQQGADNSLSFNLLNFVGYIGGLYTLDLNYTRTVGPTLAVHFNPAVTMFNGTFLNGGAELGARYFPFTGAQNGFWVGGKLGADYGELSGFEGVSKNGGSVQFQLGYTLVMGGAGMQTLAKSGFLLEGGASVGVGLLTSGLGGGGSLVVPAGGLRLAIGYAF